MFFVNDCKRCRKRIDPFSRSSRSSKHFHVAVMASPERGHGRADLRLREEFPVDTFGPLVRWSKHYCELCLGWICLSLHLSWTSFQNPRKDTQIRGLEQWELISGTEHQQWEIVYLKTIDYLRMQGSSNRARQILSDQMAETSIKSSSGPVLRELGITTTKTHAFDHGELHSFTHRYRCWGFGDYVNCSTVCGFNKCQGSTVLAYNTILLNWKQYFGALNQKSFCDLWTWRQVNSNEGPASHFDILLQNDIINLAKLAMEKGGNNNMAKASIRTHNLMVVRQHADGARQGFALIFLVEFHLSCYKTILCTDEF